MVFNSVWSILVLLYIGLTPLYMTSVFHRLAALALNVVTAIFWFAGSIAVAVGFGGPYDCRGSTACSSAEAAIAFGFFLWYVPRPAPLREYMSDSGFWDTSMFRRRCIME